MMKEAKALGTLTAGLLARKGEARPAMRPADEDQLGWNDMGVASRPRIAFGAGVAGEPPAVVRQQLELGERFATAGAAVRPRKVRSRAKGLDDGRKAAFTLRLDADRHHKLRLACALSGRSAQTIVADALDAFLGDLPASSDNQD